MHAIRRIIGFGKSSYVVSLPKKWVQDNHLNKGDTLHLIEQSPHLVISPAEQIPKAIERRQDINVDGKSMGGVKAEIIAGYVSGNDIIVIAGKQLELYVREIKSTIRNLAGLEILEQTPEKIIAKDLLNLQEVSLQHSVRRMDIIVRSMLQDAAEPWTTDNYASIAERDIDVNRLHFLSHRVINKALIDPRIAKLMEKTPFELLRHWHIIVCLEKIGDQTKRMRRYLHPSGLDKETAVALCQKQRNLFEEYNRTMQAFYKDDKESALATELKNKEIILDLNTFLESHYNTSTIRIIEIMKSTASSIKHIARFTLEH
ncbi:phosphate uptake regulator PhoU [Candidatus Woesearchaeota archaeon]|nr:phosphate uptake regulator PhoU [Candidatus Woesearchaeota archaeon]